VVGLLLSDKPIVDLANLWQRHTHIVIRSVY